jgi:hypothetical protein
MEYVQAGGFILLYVLLFGLVKMVCVHPRRTWEVTRELAGPVLWGLCKWGVLGVLVCWFVKDLYEIAVNVIAEGVRRGRLG